MSVFRRCTDSAQVKRTCISPSFILFGRGPNSKVAVKLGPVIRATGRCASHGPETGSDPETGIWEGETRFPRAAEGLFPFTPLLLSVSNDPARPGTGASLRDLGDNVLYHSLSWVGKPARHVGAFVRNGDYSLKWIATAKCAQWHSWTLARFWGHVLWNPDWDEFISIPKAVIGMATTCEDKSRAVAKKSFGVECSDWIEAHGAQRRDIAGSERDGGKHNCDTGEGGQIVWRYTVEQTGHKVRDDERTGHTQPGASGGQTESPAQDDLEDIASLSSQREANGDLAGLFVDYVGDGSIDP
jgi:hypothetical protein